MKYFVYPYIGFSISDAEKISFGMSSQQIQNILGEKPNYVMSTLEYFNDMRVDYGTHKKATAFEFFPSAELIINLDYLEISRVSNIFDLKYSQLKRLLLQCDSNTRIDGASAISLLYGLGIYHEDAEDDEIESIILFEKGYYDSLGW